MANVIIILILVVVLSFAIKSSIRHFKGEGACCGGGSGTVRTKKPKKKKLNGPVIAKRTMEISGMHCKNCVNSVTRALNGIDGVSAKVSLHSNRAEIVMDRMVDESDLRHAVEEAGFGVVNIKAS
ncbi:MAG TPA: heavy-metal-associated domain-containing protein [Candidatus Mediterraneibacter norfolkensis]|nr:heavy-metal-associated domain-containing protein [Candidatus Mediterraneibacter norfolkensis]